MNPRLLRGSLTAALAAWGCASVLASRGDCAPAAGSGPVLLRAVGGRVLYVEAQAVVPVGGDLWIAGWPSFVWRQRQDSFLPDPSDELIAAVLRPGAPALAIHPPAGLAGVADPRLADLGGGRMAVVFAETTAPPRPGTEVPFRSYHYAETTPGRDTLRTVPFQVDSGRPETHRASRLVVMGGSVAFAVPVRQGDRTDVDVFTRGPGGRWEVEHVPTRYAVYVSLFEAPSGALVLLVVRPDTTTQLDANSFSAFERTTSGVWRDRGFLRWSGRRPAHFPEVIRSGAGARVAWMEEDVSGGVMSARFGTLDLRTLRLDTLNAWIPGVESVTPVEGGPVPGEWLLEVQPRNGRPRALQVVRVADSRIAFLGTVPNPFTGPVRAVRRDGRLTVLGPLQGEFPSTPVVATALLPMARVCMGPGAPG